MHAIAADSALARRTLLTPPGARLMDLDGRLVTAHYGSVATEVAVCRKSVGLAVRSELRILEVRGRDGLAAPS